MNHQHLLLQNHLNQALLTLALYRLEYFVLASLLCFHIFGLFSQMQKSNFWRRPIQINQFLNHWKHYQIKITSTELGCRIIELNSISPCPIRLVNEMTRQWYLFVVSFSIFLFWIFILRVGMRYLGNLKYIYNSWVIFKNTACHIAQVVDSWSNPKNS